MVTSMDGILKIDAAGDLAPPGTGGGWIRPYQSLVDGYVMGTPLVLYDFDLTLDAMGGTRTVSSAHRVLQPDGLTRIMVVTDFDSATGASFLVDTQLESLDIVAPSPSVTTMVFAGAAFLARMRKR